MIIAPATETIDIQGNMVLVPKAEYEQMLKAWENEKYLTEIDRRIQRLNKGEGIHKTMEELRAMEDE